MDAIIVVLLLLLAVVGSDFLARATGWPAPLLQVVMGALLQGLQPRPVVLDPQVFFLIFLPPLLFLDGWRIPNEALRRDAGTILRLALGLVVATVLGIGLFIHMLIPAIPQSVAFALAAVLSPTDPTAVSAIAAKTPMPRRLLHVLQGEALLNDASGLICLRMAVLATLTGSFSALGALGEFAWTACVGLAVGLVVTWLLSHLVAWSVRRFGDDASGQILLTLLLPFGVYLLAESLHGSGILAAVAAGVTMSATDVWSWEAKARLRRTAVWDMVQVAVNGSIFVLLGAQIPALWKTAPHTVLSSGHQAPGWLLLYILLIIGGLLALRFAWVWLSLKWAVFGAWQRGRTAPVFSTRALMVATLAGVRGAITLAAVMTLPLTLHNGSGFPARDLVVTLAAGVILLSLLLSSLALPPLLKTLDDPTEARAPAALERARKLAAEAAILAMIEMPMDASLQGADASRRHAAAVAKLVGQYRERIDRHEDRRGAKGRGKDDLAEQSVRRTALRAERDTLIRIAVEHGLSDQVLRRQIRDLDHQEARDLG